MRIIHPVLSSILVLSFLFTLIGANDGHLFSEVHVKCDYKFILKLHIGTKNLISVCIILLVVILKCVSSIVSLLQNCLYMYDSHYS